MNSYLPDIETRTEDNSSFEEIEEETEEEKRDRHYEMHNPDPRDREYEIDTFDYDEISGN